MYRLADALNARSPDFIAPDYRLENTITAVTGKTYIGADGWRDWLQLPWVSAVWFRDGQMTHSSGFLNRGEALGAVGLRE